jgi:hypothetical protein
LRAIIARSSFPAVEPFGQFGCFGRAHVGFELLQKPNSIEALPRVAPDGRWRKMKRGKWST